MEDLKTEDLKTAITERTYGLSLYGLGFGEALKALKDGKRVAREGWHGKNMWLVLIHPGNATHTCKETRISFDMQPCIGLTKWPNIQPGWTCSQADMLAEDWYVVTKVPGDLDTKNESEAG